MNWGGFASGMEGLASVTIGSLAAAGVIGGGATPTTHVTTQVPAQTTHANTVGGLFGASGAGWNWLLIAGIAILAFVAFRFFTKKA